MTEPMLRYSFIVKLLIDILLHCWHLQSLFHHKISSGTDVFAYWYTDEFSKYLMASLQTC